jgi:tetratricopeptide (TPR) repeat protein
MVFIPVLIIFVILVAVFFIAYNITAAGNKHKHKGITKKNMDINLALKEANKRLAKDPRDIDALLFIGEQQFNTGDWENALKTYETLVDIPATAHETDAVMLNLRAAICSVNLNMIDSAFKYIVVAHSISPSNFDVIFQMGNIEFLRKNYEKALVYFQQAYALNSKYAPALRLLGHTYFKLKQTKEAMIYIRKSIEIAPNDKESLFTLAECYLEAGQKDQAEKIYSHLRPDPVWGAEACLHSGLINIEHNQEERAITDFEIGLKHKNIKPDIAIELHYQLGAAYIRAKNISYALSHLQIVQQSVSGYKNTDALIDKYKEMNANRNLEIFLMAQPAEFLALCRKIVMSYYQKAKVKITKTDITNEWADVAAEIDTPKWSDSVMFRFIRTQSAIGELVMRDFQSRLKDIKAGKGICLSLGLFSNEARYFTEARLIDLIEKDRFMTILKSIDSPP